MDDVITFAFFLNEPLKQWLIGKEKGEDKYTKSWISQKRKEVFRWNEKTFFKVFEGLSFGDK